MAKAFQYLIRSVIAVVVVLVVTIGVWTLGSKLAYNSYAERWNRAEALNAMGRMVTAQEQFRLRNQTYTNDLTALGFESGCTAHCVYLVSFDEVPNNRMFVARFVPNPAGGTNGINQTRDEGCQFFTVDSIGRRDAENRRCLEGR